MRPLLILSAIVFTVPSAASVTRWVSVLKLSERQFFVDLDTIVIDGTIRTIWLKTVRSPATKKSEAVRIEKWTHDCAFKQAKLLAVTTYNSSGGVLLSGEAPHYTQEWQRVSDDAEEQVHLRVCGNMSDSESELPALNVPAPTS